jgi:hypothetical protein
MAKFGEARRGNKPYITRTNDSNLHQKPLNKGWG